VRGAVRLTDEGESHYRSSGAARLGLSPEEYIDVDLRFEDGSLADLYRADVIASPRLDDEVLERLQVLRHEGPAEVPHGGGARERAAGMIIG
jgi:hypothetical protein